MMSDKELFNFPNYQASRNYHTTKNWIDSRWREWPMWLHRAQVLARKSSDPNTKHGCYILPSNPHIKHPLGEGYNAPLEGVPLRSHMQYRPIKYAYYQHAEMNAMIDAYKHRGQLQDSIAVVTGPSCPTCFRALVSAGVCGFIYGEQDSHCITSDDHKAIEDMQQHLGIVIVTVSQATIHDYSKQNKTQYDG